MNEQGNEQGAVVARLATHIKLYKLHHEHHTANRILSEVHRLAIALRLYESHINGNRPVSLDELQKRLQEEFGQAESQELTSLVRRLKYHLTKLQKAGYVNCSCICYAPSTGYIDWHNSEFKLTKSGRDAIECFAKLFPDSYGTIIDVLSSDESAKVSSTRACD